MNDEGLADARLTPSSSLLMAYASGGLDNFVTRRGAGTARARRLRRFARSLVSTLAIICAVGQAGAADDSPASDQVTAAWAALASGGHVALIRHGNAPPGYGGDPPGFKIDDCSTQRNLDEIGRDEARALGEAFRRHGVRVDQVQSSPWCRCLETARLMAVGPVESSWSLAPGDNPRFPARVHDLEPAARLERPVREEAVIAHREAEQLGRGGEHEHDDRHAARANDEHQPAGEMDQHQRTDEGEMARGKPADLFDLGRHGRVPLWVNIEPGADV
jgi:phosphohistidine phosphatase SixA